MKRKLSLSVLYLLTMLALFCGCTKTVKIPDVSNVELEDGKTAISSLHLIPSVEDQYSDDIAEGKIIATEPEVGTTVEENTKVILYVSQGPEVIYAEHATISYLSVSNKSDDWEFYAPYVGANTMHITCCPTFAVDVEWRGDGFGFGIAADNPSFTSSVPIEINHFADKVAKAGTPQTIDIVIPLESFGRKPTSVYTKLFVMVNGVEKDLEVSFTIDW